MRHLMSELRPRKARGGARARRERRAWPRSMWARRAIALAGAAALLVAFGATIRAPGPSDWLRARHDAIAAALSRSTVAAGFAVGEVYVRGRHETAPADVLAALDVAVGDPLLFVDLDARRARLEALPWIESAAVERRLPDVLVVRLVERRPLALWQNAGSIVVIDRGGVTIPGVDARRFAHLPLVVGEDAPGHAAELVAVLGVEPMLAQRVISAQRVGGRRWDLRFDNGIAVALPAEGWAQAWSRLAALERDQRLLARDLVRIDLRLPDRVVLRLTDEAREVIENANEDARGENT